MNDKKKKIDMSDIDVPEEPNVTSYYGSEEDTEEMEKKLKEKDGSNE